MSYKYTICHPDKPDIEYRDTPISPDEVLKIAGNYPWMQLLKDMKSMNSDEIHYNPSLEFICIEDGKSLTLTAGFDKYEKLDFSLWYNRPKKVKVLFGLLGEKEKMVVDDVWEIDFEKALKCLKFFVEKKYNEIEKLY